MRKLLTLWFVLAFVAFGGLARAEEGGAPKAAAPGLEVEDLKARVEALEKKAQETEIVDELGHKLHPIHSIYGLKINGGITLGAQAAGHVKNTDTRGALSASADLAIESPVGKNGRAVVVLDFQHGAGLRNLPALLASPNGNTTGTNADVEGFNDDGLHVTQVYYEHSFTPSLIVSAGQLDLTGYFDTNNLANSERSQFMANSFVNNPAVEFGGSENFYGPGVRVTYWPVENIDITLGAFEGNGDYIDAFDNPFLMAELNVKLKPMGREGNYRIYYWNRQGRPDLEFTADPANTALLKAENKGVGVSVDQMLTDNIGVWLRAGEQRKQVAQFDRHFSLGASVNGAACGRPDDSIGVGVGFTFIGSVYRDYKKGLDPAFNDGTETYLEAYYNYAVDGATDTTGLHVTPDIQYVVNPGGDADAGNIFIYGVRLQAFF